MTSAQVLFPNLRAAFRERLLTLEQIDHSPGVSVTLAQSGDYGVFTRASGSWIDAGFAPGQEVTVEGFTDSPLVGPIKAVTALALTAQIAGAETVAGGGRFRVALPAGRAWEGVTYYPETGRPYVAESFRPVVSKGRAVGNPGGTGTVEHQIQASANFFYPSEQGTLAVEGMAGAALTHFRRGLKLSYGGVSALIADCARAQLYADGGWIACPVTLTLIAYTQS